MAARSTGTPPCSAAHFGDYAQFQPGPGNSMGYDDLKVIEAKKFLVAVAGGERRNSTVDDAHHVAEVIAAAGRSAETGVAAGSVGARCHRRRHVR